MAGGRSSERLCSELSGPIAAGMGVFVASAAGWANRGFFCAVLWCYGWIARVLCFAVEVMLCVYVGVVGFLFCVLGFGLAVLCESGGVWVVI